MAIIVLLIGVPLAIGDMKNTTPEQRKAVYVLMMCFGACFALIIIYGVYHVMTRV